MPHIIRQTGGKGHYGHVVIDLSPGEKGEELVFENHISGGAIPKQYIASVETGICEAANNLMLMVHRVLFENYTDLNL